MTMSTLQNACVLLLPLFVSPLVGACVPRRVSWGIGLGLGMPVVAWVAGAHPVGWVAAAAAFALNWALGDQAGRRLSRRR